MAFRNQREQTDHQSTALVQRLTRHHLALTPDTEEVLIAQGIEPNMLPVMAAGCLSIGVPPNLLRYTHNVPGVVNAIKMITELGYRPGQDFYVSIFKTNIETLDENGEPTGQKAKAPTVVVMPSAARIEQNAKEDDRLRGLLHLVETGIVTDQKEAQAIFDEHFKGARPFKDAIVAYAELYTYHAKSGNPLGSGRPQVCYGFYIPWKFKWQSNEIEPDSLEQGKAKDNYEAPEIARKRAASKAWRAVTRNNYARDNRTVDDRMAALVDSASTKLSVLEQYADREGITLDDAIEMEGEINNITQKPIDNAMLTQDDNSALWDEGVWEETPEPETTPQFTWPTGGEPLELMTAIAETELPESVSSTINVLRKFHQESEGQVDNYKDLVSAIDGAFGRNSHHAYLAAICGRVVTSDNPPGRKVEAIAEALRSNKASAKRSQLLELGEYLQSELSAMVE